MRLSYPAQPSPYPNPSISTKPYSTRRIHKTEFMNLSTLSPPIPDPKLPNPPKDYNSHRGFQAALLRLVRSQAAASTVAPILNVPEIWSCAEWYRATPLVAFGFPHTAHRWPCRHISHIPVLGEIWCGNMNS